MAQKPDNRKQSRTALLLVHGIGVQNRFEFLSSVTDALRARTDGPEPEFEYRLGENRFLGRGVPLDVTFRSKLGHLHQQVEAYECHWSPLMTGRTNPVGVVAFIFRTLYRLLPWNSPTIDDSGLRAPRIGGRRFLWTTVNLIFGLAFIALAALYALSAVTLAVDRSWVRANWENKVGALMQEARADAALPMIGKQLFDSRLGSTHLPSKLPAEVALNLEGMELLRQKRLRSTSDNAVDDFADAYKAMGGRVNDEPLKSAQWSVISSLLQMKALAMSGLTQQNPAGQTQQWRDQADATIGTAGMLDKVKMTEDYLVRSGSHFFTRTKLVEAGFLPAWPEPWHAVTAFEAKDVALGLAFAILMWTVVAGGIATVVRSLLRSTSNTVDWFVSLKSHTKDWKWDWRSSVRGLASLVSICLLIAVSVSIPDFNNDAYLIAVSVLLLRFVYNLVQLLLVDTVGDVEIYAQRNANSAKYEARTLVLDRATRDIRELCESGYDSIVIAGHSLGSVVALEALRRVYDEYATHAFSNSASNGFEKVKAFVTFGSPLEKFAVFFAAERYQRRFADLNRSTDSRMFRTPDDGASASHRIRWYNFWNSPDIVADLLEEPRLLPQEG